MFHPRGLPTLEREEPWTVHADTDRDGRGLRDPADPAEALFHLEEVDAMLCLCPAERLDHRPPALISIRRTP